MFTNYKKQLSSRSVIVLTRLDTPPVESDQKPTFKRVIDLVDSNIDLKIINVAEDEYKPDIFYTNFLINANKGTEIEQPLPVWDPKEIEHIMHQQSHRHLAVARLSFEIGEGMSIGVAVYNLLISSPQYRQKKVNLDRVTNAPVTSITKTVKVVTETNSDVAPMDVDGEETEPKQMPILKSEILHYQIIGGERIEFSDDEKKKLSNPFGPPMLKLLGFKPSAIMCKEKWFLKSGYFLFPNESIIEGSTVAFKALHQACMETGVVGICVLCTRVNSRPTIVALSPCSHPLGLDVEIGFDVIHIPFVEHVRELPVVEDDGETSVSGEQKALMKEILEMVKFDYKADMFENPKIQCDYRAVEAHALDEDDLDPFVDTTIANPETFAPIPADLFEELFGPFEVTVKRPAKEPGDVSSSKRSKMDIEIDEDFIKEIKERIKYRTVHKYTVAQLKDILKSKDNPNIPALTGLKKDKLVDLVYKYY